MVNNPVDAVLFCPICSAQHIDQAEPDVCETCGLREAECDCAAFTAWLNPPHRTHRCRSCNHVWRPFDYPTNGVTALQMNEIDGESPEH